ncbi:carboxylate--amine ligase [Sulfodiicoccus acidiphilus]|uniref:Carboxylate--amine ligase n=1 Tax=Sulfodiicoccus acidiphilus TaxID=1670455 RepID=A0A348B1C6_9CREN|nr:PAC2 family protein [Sulfodiicoccus acidiphilus]BBD71978.1 carboxylate--amine ligase [Sulfodiicoccus acidiphilus]GGT91893.1 carboxylate--amine ligase [Sulfodiicoccus acidiphilus]
MSVRVILKDAEESQLEGKYFITGFRTLGETGYLAARYLVTAKRMKRIGFVVTKYQRDVAFLDDYGLATPYEIFYDDQDQVIVLLNHLLPFEREWSPFALAVTKWLKRISPKEVFLIGGLDKRYKNDQTDVRWLSTSKSTVKLDFPNIEKQLLMVGPLALLTVYAEIMDVPATVILPFADRDRADPQAAAVAIEVLKKVIGISVDVNQLYEDARKIQEELRRQMELMQNELSKFRSGDRVYM